MTLKIPGTSAQIVQVWVGFRDTRANKPVAEAKQEPTVCFTRTRFARAVEETRARHSSPRCSHRNKDVVCAKQNKSKSGLRPTRRFHKHRCRYLYRQQAKQLGAQQHSHLAQEVPGAVLHDPDVGLRFSEADVVRPQAAVVEVVRAAGRHHLHPGGRAIQQHTRCAVRYIRETTGRGQTRQRTKVQTRKKTEEHSGAGTIERQSATLRAVRTFFSYVLYT